ncbi:MAG: TldD/PmbA family protein [Promethearchaeota archaeon]
MSGVIFDDIQRELTRVAGEFPCDFYDVRCVVARGSSIDLVKDRSREVSESSIQGVGIRVLKDSGWGFSATNTPEPNRLAAAFKTAWKLAKVTGASTSEKFTLEERDPFVAKTEVTARKPLEDIGIDEKLLLVREQDRIARDDPRVVNTHFVYSDGTFEARYFDCNGREITSRGSSVRLGCAVFAKETGDVQKGSRLLAGRGGFEVLEDQGLEHLGSDCALEATSLLDSKPSPAGKFTLIMDPKLCGTFIHEAFGHPCEADAILQKSSVLEGRVGERVGVDGITIVDDATIEGSYGFYHHDSEGTPGQRTVLVEDGILKGFLHSLETASRLGVEPTGNGRAQSYDYTPQVRMSSTLLEPGDYSFEELVEDIKHGIYAQDWLYGYTDPGSGSFMFKVKKAQLIEGGELQDRLYRDAAMSGITLEVLGNVTGLGKVQDRSPGVCGKGGQGVPVGDGGVHVRVRDIVIGGRH